MTPILALALAIAAPALSGTVQGPDEKPVTTAVVIAQQNGRTFTVAVDAQGAFSMPDVTLPVTIEVQAPGFLTLRQTIDATPVVITLNASRIRESVIVTAPASEEVWRRPVTGTTVLPASTLQMLPAVTTDEALRVVSGLSLFRRSSSRASNPTTHGVTMRGLSASGASRGLVLFDGLPMNDGFGAWVTWTRIPALAASQITIDRGAEGTTFGSDALGGVLDIRTGTGDRRGTTAATSMGTEGLGSIDAATGGRSGRVAWFGAASWFTTDGVIPVAPESRGAVDTPADAEWSSAFGRVAFGNRGHRLTISGWGGSDDRGNGTVLQRNRMSGGTGSASYDSLVRATNFAARVAVSPNSFDQSFSSVAAGRNSETLLFTQFTDTVTTRALVEAGRPIRRGYLAGRFMMTRANATFTEERPATTVTLDLRDNSEAVSVHGGWTPASNVTIAAGVRSEWRAAPVDTSGRNSATVGHVSGALQMGNHFTARGGFATSHRWPTLNELVRGFQAGAVLTLANPDLLPERARSADAALTMSNGRWSASVAGFWTVVGDAIANVTIQTTPSIVRQRRNAGDAVAQGMELDGEARPWTFLRLRASATFVDARFRNSADPALEGKRLPQVPRASASISGDVSIRTWLQAAVVYRFLSEQFDDDRNVFELARASQVDVRVFGRVRAFEWHVTVENGADARIEVGRTPLVTLAPGRAVRVGLIYRR